MKRKWLVAIVASVIAVGGAISATVFSDSLSSTKNDYPKVEVDDDEMVTLDTKTILSVEELFDIVLSEVDGTIEEIELEAYDKDNVYFEVEVKQKGKEYKVYVDAYSGKVLETRLDDDDDDKRQAKKENSQEQSNDKNKEKQPSKQGTVDTKQTEQPKSNNVKKETNTNDSVEKETKSKDSGKKVEQNKPKKESKNEQSKKSEKKQNKTNDQQIISTEEAIQIALSKVDGKVTEVELDRDDGRLEYEIEIDLPNGKEAEFEIDAYTGKILEFELDD